MTHRLRRPLCLATLLLLLLLPSSHTWAIGEASTTFLIFVPPNNDNNGRNVCLVVTALNEATTTVDIIDDDADGDSDDTVLQAQLSRGQSYILYHKDGAVNDDAGGKWDGDYFQIRADYPVVVQMATRSNWQHDWVPGQNKTSRDTNFFIWAPPTSGEDNDIDVYAYEDDTQIEILDVTASPSTLSGPSSVDLQSGRQLLKKTLMRGEDLVVRHNLGIDILDPGHTYWVRASKPVTVQYGHLGSLSGTNSVRDGGGFVPSSSGNAVGDTYFFSIPHHPGAPAEKELRVVSYDDGVTFTLMGWNPTTGGFDILDQQSLQADQHLDYVGSSHPSFRDTSLYHVSISPPGKRVTLFESSWLESGSSGTSDYASAVSSSSGHGAGTEFVTYLGPPGYQNNWTTRPDPSQARYSHLFLYGLAPQATVQIKDLDTNGAIFNQQIVLDRNGYHDVAIDLATYNLMNTAGRRPYLKVTSSAPIAMHNTNFNDNWLTYATSPLEADPTISAVASSPSLHCAESTTLTVDFGMTTNLALTNAELLIHLPQGFSLVPNTLSSTHPDVLPIHLVESTRLDGGKSLSFDLLTSGLVALTSHQLTFDVSLDCTALTGCLQEGLADIQLSLRGEDILQDLYASRTHVAIATTRDAFDQVLGIDAYWDTDANAARVGFLIGAEAGGALYEVTRASSPDASYAPIAYLNSHGPSASETVYWFNDHSVATGQTYYYNINVQRDDGCVTTHGPLPIYLDAASSSGAQGGLESNGRMADQLAMRDIERRFLSPGTLYSGLLEAGALSLPARHIPPRGPRDSVTIDTSPHDLVHYTNATQVAARDYVDRGTGETLASVLITRTNGEIYEHSKPLCDRAGGATLEHLFHDTLEQFGRHELIRYRLRHPRHGTLDHATSFKLYGPASKDEASHAQPWRLHSAWLRHDYPTPEDPTRPVLNVQIWAREPGLEMWLAEQVIASVERDHRLDASSSTSTKNRTNKPYFSEGDKKGQHFHIVTQSPSPRALDQCIIALHEVSATTSATTTHELPLRRPSGGRAGLHTLNFERPPLLDATVQLICHGHLIDELWLSDGTWTEFSDNLWGGTSTTQDLTLNGCDNLASQPSAPPAYPHPTADTLRFSGCGTIDAQVDQMAGLARHFGGGAAALDLSSSHRLSAWVSGTHEVEACLHARHTPGQMPLCHTFTPTPEGGWHVFDPEAMLARSPHATAAHLEGIYLISFAVTQPGASFELSVSHLELTTLTLPSPQSMEQDTPTTPTTRPQLTDTPAQTSEAQVIEGTKPASSKGCQTGEGPRPLHLTHVAALIMWLFLLYPTRTRKPTTRQRTS